MPPKWRNMFLGFRLAEVSVLCLVLLAHVPFGLSTLTVADNDARSRFADDLGLCPIGAPQRKGLSFLAFSRGANSRTVGQQLERGADIEIGQLGMQRGGVQSPTPLEVELMTQVDALKQTTGKQAAVIAQLQQEQLQESSVAVIQSQKVAGLMQTSVLSNQQLHAALHSQQALQAEQSQVIAALQAARSEAAQEKQRSEAFESKARWMQKQLEDSQASLTSLRQAKASMEHNADQVVLQLREQFDAAVKTQIAQELREAAEATEKAEADEAHAQVVTARAEHVQAAAQTQANQMASAMDLAGAKMANAMRVLGGLPETRGLMDAYSMATKIEGRPGTAIQ